MTLQSEIRPESHVAPDENSERAIKCVVWDLDHTIWNGILLEDREVTLRPEIPEVLRVLDERGILHSIASRNDPETAMAKLRELGLNEYFLYPQINWNSKSGSVKKIAEALNIGLDALCFIDDQPFERDEVAHSLPQVLCLDASLVPGLADMSALMPRLVTPESAQRRHLYMRDLERKMAEGAFEGPKEEFLAELGLRFRIAPCQEGDLARAEELTVRTHQLNATGYTYSYEELRAFSTSSQHLLLVAELEDRYGSYGKIGLALLEKQPEQWTLKLLLMSCRAMSRGVGSMLLSYVMNEARRAGVRLLADFVRTERNRMMQVTFRFAGFREHSVRDGVSVLEGDLSQAKAYPAYVSVNVDDAM